ncbi:MAG: DUF1570 domain-containing protein [Phycisphaerae bacterium]|nr:DUF1570 domain-containing protein [Phycisphaerae bacterium]
MNPKTSNDCGGNYRPIVGIAAVAIVLTLGCQPAPPVPRFQLTQEEWSYNNAVGQLLTTDHFEIYTTIADQELRAVLPLFLESAYQLYTSLLPPITSDNPRMQTYLFNSRFQWDRFVRDTFPRRYRIYARIQHGGFAEGRMCVVYYLRRAYTLSIIAHEGMHQYFGSHFKTRIPAWLNEGLATYCEGFDFRDGAPVFLPRLNTFRLNPLRRTLTSDALIPLPKLLATHAGEVVGEGHSGLTSAYYAQVWALTVFLRHGQGGRYAPGFARMLEDIRNGSLHTKARAARLASGQPGQMSLGEAVFRAYITHDLETVEQHYRDYMIKLAGFRDIDARH